MRRLKGRWSAPGRVNLMGEHLDYNGGPVLPIAIDRRTTVAANVREDAEICVSSEQEDEVVRFGVPTEPGDVTGWAAYVAAVFWALGDAGWVLPGAGLRISSDVPVGAGLSSSAALECAVAVALRDLAGLDIDDVALALLAQRAENDYVGVPSGAMDQLASLCGEAGHAVHLDTTGPSVELVPADWEGDGVALLVIDTGVSHALGDGEYGRRRHECEQAAAALGLGKLAQATSADLVRLDDPVLRRRAYHVVSEVARVSATAQAVRDSKWATVGELFTASHASLRDDFEVSSPELDAAVAAALDAGALGARMTGGGFGGSAIALAPRERRDPVAQACAASFASQEWQPPAVFTVAPSDGARRED